VARNKFINSSVLNQLDEVASAARVKEAEPSPAAAAIEGAGTVAANGHEADYGSHADTGFFSPGRTY